jgi:acyl-coenzyme A synthetase/AMP-(fatty) acid ligase
VRTDKESIAIFVSARHGGVAKEALENFREDVALPSIYFQEPYRRFMKTQALQRKLSGAANGETPEPWLETPPPTLGQISQSPKISAVDLNSRRKVARENHYVSDTDRNVLILHSSGTTGLPKAIRQPHRYMLHFAPYTAFEFDDFHTLPQEQTMALNTLPLFHCFGLLSPVVSLSIGKPFAIPPPNSIPSAAATLDFIRRTNAGTLVIVPSILQDIAEMPDDSGIQVLRSLEYVVSGGAPLSERIGDMLVQAGVKLIDGYGATETGCIGLLEPPRSDRDWRYFVSCC